MDKINKPKRKHIMKTNIQLSKTKRNILVGLIGLMLLMPSLSVSAFSTNQNNPRVINQNRSMNGQRFSGNETWNQNQNTGRGRNAGISQDPLSQTEANFLQEAILEEYGAYNLYRYIFENYYDSAPFKNIMQAELKHIDALVRQAEKYDISIPENPGLESEPVFENLEDACQVGVDAELADADLYDELLPSMEHSDIIRVFNNLKNASLNNHLPAFEKCN